MHTKDNTAERPRTAAEVRWVAPIHGLRLRDSDLMGAKCAGLGELAHLGVEVPAGFAVPCEALDAVAAAARAMGQPPAGTSLPAPLVDAITAAYEALCDTEASPDMAVAVRLSLPSGTPEPAGAHTALNLRGPDAVIEAVRDAWASLFTPEGFVAAGLRGEPLGKVRAAVLVQRMVPSESAGTVRTAMPGSDRILVESAWGLGDALSLGRVRPDRFTLERKSVAILSSEIVQKGTQSLPEPACDTGGPRTRTHAIDAERAVAPSLTPEEVCRLAETALRAESHFGEPVELAFAVEWRHGGRRIRIVGAKGLATVHLPPPAEKAHAPRPAASPVALPATATRILVTLKDATQAEAAAKVTFAEGVGLLPGEALLVSVGPIAADTVDAWAKALGDVATAFAPRPVVYRFQDLGVPAQGGRGLAGILRDAATFRLECRALRLARAGNAELHVMLPFARTVRELRAAKRILEEEGLARGRGLRLWAMCEAPSMVLTIDRFIEEGIDGVEFGDGLAALVLGADLGGASGECRDPLNAAVLRAVAHVVHACTEAGVATSACGDMTATPEVVAALVREGVGQISVSPDRVAATKEMAAEAERRLLLDGARRLHQGRPAVAHAPLAAPLQPAPWWKGA